MSSKARTPEQKITRARSELILKAPFFGSLALRLKMEPDEKIQTACCDGKTLRYNPKFIETLDLDQTTGLVAHEVMHPAFLHHTRRGSRNVKKWNRACDYSINSLLVNSKFTLPTGSYVNHAYNGMTAEHIFTLIPDDPDDNNSDGQNDPGGDGGVSDAPGASSSSQVGHEEAEWKIAVAGAAHMAKQQGNLPGDVERMMEELFEPVLPWRDILRRFMTEKSNDDFSWKRGNRRFLSQGLYLPSRQSEGSGEMVVCIDTSGSIGEKELNEFGGEIRSIVKDVRPSKTYVIYCDAEVNHVDEFAPDDELEFHPHGGGGTDFRPPFKWLEGKGIEPKALVYLTDGYGNFGNEAGFPTMWAINNHEVTPPWGEHLILDFE